MSDLGEYGEKIMSEFVDSNFTSLLAFRNPKNKKNEEICDILIWLNYTVILCEVKTRKSGEATHSWVKSKIEQSVEQLSKSYNKIKNNDTINLKNSKYHTQLDCRNIKRIIGLVIFVHDNEIGYCPTEFINDVYKKDLPIHFFSWNYFSKLNFELKTIQDLLYYLKDRYEYLNNHDIPFNEELNAIGYYKSHKYTFPQKRLNHLTNNYWSKYIKSHKSQIFTRELRSDYSFWIDFIEKTLVENKIHKERKLYDNIPLGMYVAFEFTRLDFATRCEIGNKIAETKQWFLNGKTNGKFAYRNELTHNWIVFFFSTEVNNKRFSEITRLKYIQLKYDEGFSLGVYAISFKVDVKEERIAIQNIILQGDADLKKLSSDEIIAAKKIWGGKTQKEISEY